MQFSRPIAALFMITRVYLRSLMRKIVSLYQTESVMAQEGRSNFSVTEI